MRRLQNLSTAVLWLWCFASSGARRSSYLDGTDFSSTLTNKVSAIVELVFLLLTDVTLTGIHLAPYKALHLRGCKGIMKDHCPDLLELVARSPATGATLPHHLYTRIPASAEDFKATAWSAMVDCIAAVAHPLEGRRQSPKFVLLFSPGRSALVKMRLLP